MNFPEVIVYEIYRNQGCFYVRENKYDGSLDVVRLARSASSGSELVVSVGKSDTKNLRDVE